MSNTPEYKPMTSIKEINAWAKTVGLEYERGITTNWHSLLSHGYTICCMANVTEFKLRVNIIRRWHEENK